MKRLLLSTIAFIAAAAAPALAADLPVKAVPQYQYVPPQPLAPFSWTGCYIGGNVGGADSRSGFITNIVPGTHLTLPANISAVDAAGTGSASNSGFIGGGQIGCNYQVNQFVIGIEGDFDSLGTKPTLNGSGVLTTGDTFNIINSVRTNWLATVRPRVGIAVDHSLFYVTGGAAFANFNYTQSYTDTLFAASGASSVSTTKSGWTVGGGWEYAFAPHWSVKAEYLFARFTSVSTTGTVVSTTGNSNVLNGSADLQTHIGRVGLNYRF
jgi:outer membrane immunogenic protein